MKNKAEQNIPECVLMMRKIRDRLSRRYNKNPELLHRDLENIRKKYNFKDKKSI